MKHILVKYLRQLVQLKVFEKHIYKWYFNRLGRQKNLYSEPGTNPRLFWGPIPIINNKYFSLAMKEAGFVSNTVMHSYYSINTVTDFDYYYHEVGPKIVGIVDYIFFLKNPKLSTLTWLLANYDIFHISYLGLGILDHRYWGMELRVLERLNKKIIVLPYGADAYQYSKVINESLKHALMLSYPNFGSSEEAISDQVRFWQKNADCRVSGIFIDGFSKWDVLPVSYIAIDEREWHLKKSFSDADGINGTVKILHTPNHRGFKGTEFILSAVDRLKRENLKIELILIEKKPNSEVKELMQQSDILVEQIIFIGYAMSGLEGMASGLPVISNLSDERYTRLFRRYSYLNESPILSTTPENIYDNLKLLVRNPQLRRELGLAGRAYVKKYHSYSAAQVLFKNIYSKIWEGKDTDLMNMFHPLNPDSYNNQSPKIEHPLFENRIPEELMKTLNT